MNPSGRALQVVGAALMGALAAVMLALAIAGDEFAAGFGAGIAWVVSTAIGRGVFAAGSLVVITLDLVLLLRALGLGGSKIIEFENETGRMVVDVTALEECLRRTALEDPDVTEASASIRIPSGGISRPTVCNLDVGLLERADVPGKGSEVQARIRRRFLQIIPIDKDPIVNLHIRIRPPAQQSPVTAALTPAAGIEAAGAPRGQEPKPLPDVPEFTGERRYAVPDEEEPTT